MRKVVVVVVVRRPSVVVVVVRLPRNPKKAKTIRKLHKEFVCESGICKLHKKLSPALCKKYTFLRWKLTVYYIRDVAVCAPRNNTQLYARHGLYKYSLLSLQNNPQPNRRLS